MVAGSSSDIGAGKPAGFAAEAEEAFRLVDLLVKDTGLLHARFDLEKMPQKPGWRDISTTSAREVAAVRSVLKNFSRMQSARLRLRRAQSERFGMAHRGIGATALLGAIPELAKRSPETRAKVLGRAGAIGMIAFLTLIDLFGSQALLPTLVAHYGVSPAAMGFAVNASTIGMAVAGLSVALFARRIDRKRGIWVSLVLLASPEA
ncbi:MAG: hypothetical protein AAFV62_05130, partial [Pseudomonadota bacterium]